MNNDPDAGGDSPQPLPEDAPGPQDGDRLQWQGGSVPPDAGNFATPGPGGRGRRRWPKRVGAAVAAAAILVAAGYVGDRLGNSSSPSDEANQAIPSPAAQGVTSQNRTINVAAVTAKVEPGVVDITAQDPYQNETSAGTGMVLTANGEVLTNNHVIRDATKITVQVMGVGPKYTATVVGYDQTQDIALLQLQGASGLKTVTVGNSDAVRVGIPVVAIGNALALPGRPTVTSGAITALGRSVTASDGGSGSENLSNLFQSDASICSGNSGGPLANSSGQVISMNTAAQTDSNDSCSTVGFSIPINTALAIANQIQKGQGSQAVHIGLPAFLGVDVINASAAQGQFGGYGYSPPTNSGALITNVLPQTPAQSAGLQAGDVITQANGTQITSETDLGNVISKAKPGQSMSFTWLDSSDQSHSASVTLTTGPAG